MVLEMIDCRFLISHIATIQDNKFVYFISEYIEGTSLMDVLESLDILNKEQAQFYVSQLIIAVQYLHSLKLMHRDIRPENMIVDL
jgi:serine/threonine protein kinase